MKPILFNTEMVKAILEGRKTVTRRVVKEKGWDITGRPKFSSDHTKGEYLFSVCMENKEANARTATCHFLKPPYEIEEILYIRETWGIQSAHRFECDVKIAYKAGGELNKIQFCKRKDYDDFVFNKRIGDGRWYPSIHMPKEAARIFLRVTDVRVERLHKITPEQAVCEGVGELFIEACAYDDKYNNIPWNQYDGLSIHQFARLWDSTIKPSDICKYGWDANPYVWVIEFERCDKQEEHK